MGANQFLTLATLSVGSEGPQTAIDLLSLSNPSGLDSNLTFICTGKFIGDISIEGSPSSSGDDWDVITQFNSGISADSNPLQSPASQDVITVNNVVVRRIRANVRGRVLSATTLTVAGQQNCDCQLSGSADWPLDIGRYFFIDPVLGNDANIGYIDAALGSTFTVEQKNAVARATYPAFREILPPSGNNRVAILLMMPGNYGDLDFRGISGYKQFIRRGSDGTNTVTDRTTCGFVTAYGPFTVDAGSTTSSIPTVEALPAGVLAYGLRIRFTSGALSGTFAIYNRTTGAAAIPEVNLASAPVAGVTYVIERPGVVCTAYYEIVQNNNITFTSNVLGALVTAGVRVDSTTGRSCVQGAEGGSQPTYTGFDQTGQTGSTTPLNIGFAGIRVSNAYVDETATSRTVGMSARYEDSVDWRSCVDTLTVSSIYCVGSWVNAKANRFGGGTLALCSSSGYFAMGFIITNPIDGSPDIFGRVIGTVLATARPTYVGGVSPFGGQISGIRLDSSAALVGIDLSNIGAFPCVKITGDGTRVAIDDLFSSAGGNTDVAIALDGGNQAYNASLRVFNGNTLSPTLGEIRLAGGAITTYAGLTLTNVVDINRNNVYGSVADGFAGHVVDECTLVSNQSGGALTVGAQVRNNGTTGQVTSALATQAAPANANVNGVMVTPPASAALGYMVAAGSPACNFDGVPSLAATGGIAYLSPGTTGTLTTTIPAVAANAQKLRVGRIISISGTTARVAFHPENLAVLADGLA